MAETSSGAVPPNHVCNRQRHLTSSGLTNSHTGRAERVPCDEPARFTGGVVEELVRQHGTERRPGHRADQHVNRLIPTTPHTRDSRTSGRVLLRTGPPPDRPPRRQTRARAPSVHLRHAQPVDEHPDGAPHRPTTHVESDPSLILPLLASAPLRVATRDHRRDVARTFATWFVGLKPLCLDDPCERPG